MCLFSILPAAQQLIISRGCMEKQGYCRHLIKSLSVNYANLPPADNCSSQMEETDEARGRLLIAHEEFAEAFEPRMGDFDDPTPWTVGRVVQDDRTFFLWQRDMGRVVMLAHDFIGRSALVAFVNAEMDFKSWAELWHDQRI